LKLSIYSPHPLFRIFLHSHNSKKLNKMKKLFMILLVCIGLISHVQIEAGPPIGTSAFRVSGTVVPYTSGCWLFADQCTGVNYILEGDASQYANGGQYCAVLKAVAPSNCGVSAEFRIMNIKTGLCPDGGTFCHGS
jgi:hypothetical protein